jgi:hypothetical protein
MMFGPPPPKMICHHKPGDHSCTAQFPRSPDPVVTPDASKYEVVDVRQVGSNLVLRVKYPNCRSCAFEGTKVLLFLECSPLDALKWKKIDPHFRDHKGKAPPTEAPSPAVRFPGSDLGWNEALAYAHYITSR